jgi:hypothetical protein
MDCCQRAQNFCDSIGKIQVNSSFKAQAGGAIGGAPSFQDFRGRI